MNAARKLSSLVIVLITLPLYLAACMLPGAGKATCEMWEKEALSIIS